MLRRKMDGKHTLCEPAQSKCTWTWYKSHFVWKFKGKMPDPNPGDIVLCEPAQSKSTWTFHKSHFLWKFTGKMPNTNENTSIKHQAFYTFRKNPFSVATLFGEKVSFANSKKLSRGFPTQHARRSQLKLFTKTF